MSRSFHRIIACGLALGLAQCGESSVEPQVARFTFRDPLTQDVVRIEIANSDGLQEAEALLQSGGSRWAIGTPRRGNGGFNAPWTWHLDPASISFAEITIEACQSAAAAVADDLDYWINFGQVCLWGKVEARER